MRNILFFLTLAVLFAGCTERGEKAQTWSGTVGDKPVSLSMHERYKVESGPDIQNLINAGMQAFRGDITGALAAAMDDSNDRFDVRLAAMSAESNSRLDEVSGNVTNTQVGAGGGALLLITTLITGFLKNRKKDDQMLAMAKQLPPDTQVQT